MLSSEKKMKRVTIFISMNHHETDQKTLAQALAKVLLSLNTTTHELRRQSVGCSLPGWLAARRPNWTERHALFILENGLTKKTVRPSIRQTKHLIVHLRLTIERAVTASDSTVSDGLRLQIFFVTIFTS